VLNTAPTTTTLPVKDMNRARSFYEKTLGLKPLGFAADGNFMFACAGRSTIALIPKPQGTKAERGELISHSQAMKTVRSAIEKHAALI
jgi:catechol 2,3-dioxygenase-like lactoylglutathione lyase family enzyme